MPERPPQPKKNGLPGMETQKRKGKDEGQADLFDMGSGDFNAVEIEKPHEREAF